MAAKAKEKEKISLRERILKIAYGYKRPFRIPSFELPSVCENCFSEFVFVQSETLFQKTFICGHCGIVFSHKRMRKLYP